MILCSPDATDCGGYSCVDMNSVTGAAVVPSGTGSDAGIGRQAGFGNNNPERPIGGI